MKRINFLFVVIGMFALSGLFGCSTPTDADLAAMNSAGVLEDVSVQVSSAALEASDICGGVIVTVYSSEANYDANNPGEDLGTGQDVGFPYSITIDDDGYGTWSGSFTDIPAGADRFFVANAYGDTDGDDDCDEVIFNGTITEDVAPGMGAVTITLVETTEHLSVDNTAPVVTNLVIDKKYVAVGETVCMTATAEDPNPLTGLDFTWQFTDGDAGTTEPAVVVTPESPNAPLTENVCWTPTDDGDFDLTLTVSDNLLSTTLSIKQAIVVYDVIDFDVNLEINESPVINSFIVAPGLAAAGATVTLTVNATDDDLDYYEWGSDCAGVFATVPAVTTTNSTTFVIDSGVAIDTACTFDVTVYDEVGNNSSASSTIFVGPPDFTPTYTDPQDGGV